MEARAEKSDKKKGWKTLLTKQKSKRKQTRLHIYHTAPKFSFAFRSVYAPGFKTSFRICFPMTTKKKMEFPHGIFVITSEQYKVITETFKYVTGKTLSKLNTVLSFLTSWKVAHAGVLPQTPEEILTKEMNPQVSLPYFLNCHARDGFLSPFPFLTGERSPRAFCTSQHTRVALPYVLLRESGSLPTGQGCVGERSPKFCQVTIQTTVTD